MTHRLAQADVESAVAILRAGRGWDAAVAAVNARRPGAPPASRRTIRRLLKTAGLLEAFPRMPRILPPGVKEGRPRKPVPTDEEFKLAIAKLAGMAATPWLGLVAAAELVSARRIADAGATSPADVKKASVSPTWLDRQLRAGGWTPPPRPQLPPIELEATA